MAKQESNYSKEDKEAFKEKDLRITRLSCLNRATDIAIAFWTHPLLKQIDATNVQSAGVAEICKMADAFVDWVYGYGESGVVNSVSNHNPQPTIHETPLPEQEKIVMREIVKTLSTKYPDKRIDVTSLEEWIYNTFGKYPKSIDSVSRVVNTAGIEVCLK